MCEAVFVPSARAPQWLPICLDKVDHFIAEPKESLKLLGLELQAK